MLAIQKPRHRVDHDIVRNASGMLLAIGTFGHGHDLRDQPAVAVHEPQRAQKQQCAHHTEDDDTHDVHLWMLRGQGTLRTDDGDQKHDRREGKEAEEFRFLEVHLALLSCKAATAAEVVRVDVLYHTYAK